MKLWELLPAPPPGPPIPGRLLFGSSKVEDEGDEGEEDQEVLDRRFKGRLKKEGFDPELIDMGMKVADNHSRSREDALKIGENYIREMAK